MPPRHPLSDDDTALFRSAVAGVRRIESERPAVAPARPPARRRPRPVADAVSDALMPDGVGEAVPALGDRQFFARSGVQQRLLRRLARGQVRVDEELDLHGLRVDDARDALARFLEECRRRAWRCVRVVTGKGLGSRGAAPVLKAQVDRWLRLRPEVLAFCSAPPRDGGTGAVLVLLRRSREP